METASYWDDRAKKCYCYKGEKFYTFTPIPYYYSRRKIVLKSISSLIKPNSSICDFGCGDGEYISKLFQIHSDCRFHGVDISSQMISLAKERNSSERITFETSGTGIQSPLTFDLVYSSAVFAHVSDSLVQELFNNIVCHIQNGCFCLCEQSAPFYYSGETFIRRPKSQYISMLRNSGFTEFESFTIDFWLYRLLFERRFGKFIISKYMRDHKINNKADAMIQLNKNFMYRLACKFFCDLSYPRIFREGDRWGYVFIEAYK